ncbi:flagellar assembly protein FliH [Sutcliffiella rhizosphaerae]|uniref:flagellar assembly protein FliH n=1 Tax=Sutcliffiella rhizosphaerae TaxID=2880967 RepID=UPI001E4F4AEF|nr:flagellar assembly protein FliH [Sutcliffiella rhizosphaerae]
MSRLIKSSRLQELSRETISIKVAPIFTANKRSEEEEAGSLSIEHINNLIEQAERKASKILEQAEIDKQNTLTTIENDKKAWKNEKEDLQKQAYAIGYDEGFTVGKKEAFDQNAFIINQAKEILELSKEEHHKKLDNSIESIVALSMKVAEKILGKTLDSDPTSFTKLVQAALIEVKEKEEVKLFTSPSDFPYLIQNKEQLQSVLNSQYDLVIYPDTELSKGECWIDSSAGRMDVSLQTQLQEIKEHLLQLVNMESKS